MELRHLRYFIAVAETLNFGRAASRLNMSQPPLSRQIKELEAELGFALFERKYHDVQLTAAGQQYLSAVRRLFVDLDVARQDAFAVASGRTGRLRIGYSSHLPSVYLTRLLANFKQQYPDVAVEIVEAPTPQLIEWLLEKAIDVALPILPLRKEGVVVEEILSEPLVMVLSAQHPLAKQRRLALEQLAGEEFILCRSFAEAGYHELVVGLCEAAGFSPNVTWTADHTKTVLDSAAEGMSVSIVPASAKLLRERGLRYRPLPASVPPLRTGIAWRQDSSSTLIAAFVAAVKQVSIMEVAPLQ